MKSSLFYAAAATAVLPAALGSPLKLRSNSTMVYDFSDLTPSAELIWTPCFDNFTCARLEVPLDYSNVSVGTLNLAVIKAPGESEDAQEVLVNPGGPGTSSVDFVKDGYKLIQSIFGSQHAVIGIDPRGVGNSEPSSDCFSETSEVARNAFFSEVFMPADIDSVNALKLNHQSLLAYGDWCSEMYAVNGTAKYASTVATAQDMLHYIELRAKSLGKAPEEAKLWYFGGSYGTALGATFASLYPDRTEKMILDGAMDLEDHYNGGWESSIADADEAVRLFFKMCFEAGPDVCRFHQNATSWQQLEKRYWDLMHTLKENPIGIGKPSSVGALEVKQRGGTIIPSVLTYRSFITQLFSLSYQQRPVLWYSFDLYLSELQNGTYENLSALDAQATIAMDSITPTFNMARTLVNCLDSNGRANYTKFEDYERFINSLCDTSIYGCLAVAPISGPVCSNLKVFSPESQTFDGIPRGSTPAPILFVSALYDPITPLSNARKMQSLFPGSGLLVLNKGGHGVFGNSECAHEHMRQYVLDGTLPPSNTTCDDIKEKNMFKIYYESIGIQQG